MKSLLITKMDKQTLEDVIIHGAKIKLVIETDDKFYLLYSLAGREQGTEPWFSNAEILNKWTDKLHYTKDVKHAQELGFNLEEKDLDALKKEGYAILGFAKP